MNNYNEQSEQEECECIVCDHIDEFKQLVKDKVDWESALRHILHSVISKTEILDDEFTSDLIEEVYMDGFTDGLESGVEKAHSLMLALVEDTDDRAELYRSGELDEDNEDEYKTEEAEDLTDEQFDEIQKIISGDL